MSSTGGDGATSSGVGGVAGGSAAPGGSAGMSLGGAGAGGGVIAAGFGGSSAGAAPGAGLGGAPAAGGGGAPAAGSSSLGPPGPDGFAIEAQLASELKETAPTTVGIVRWSLDKPNLTEAHIDFGLDATYGMTAPVELTRAAFRTVLVGMKPEKTYHFRIAASDGSQTYMSDDRTITTGAATTLVPLGSFTAAAPAKVDKGFIIGSFWMQVGDWATFILDTDGDIVWWYVDKEHSRSSDGIGRARLSADSQDVWLINGQVSTGLRRVSIDTLDVQTYEDATGTHDICAVSGDTMAFLASTSPGCASIVEIDKAGVQKPVFDSSETAGEKCHGNAIRYAKNKDWYVFSDRDTDVYVLDRAGTMQWKLSDKVSGGHEAWGGVQHGVQLLDASILIFANEPDGDWEHSQAIEFGLDGSVIKQFENRSGTDWFGDVQRLPSGNTLITYMGVIQEVDPSDDVLLEVRSGEGLNGFGYMEFRQSLYGPPLDIQP